MNKKQTFRIKLTNLILLYLFICVIECGSRLKSKKCDYVMKGLCLNCNSAGLCSKFSLLDSKSKTPSGINLNDLNKVEDLLEVYDSSGNL